MTDTWIWPWLLLAVGIAILACEFYALAHHRTTLSRYVVGGTKAWPLIPFLAGLIVGGLAVHFWWPWCPDQGIGIGLLSSLGVACEQGPLLSRLG